MHEQHLLPQIPEHIAMAMRFDQAPDDALLPPEVVSAATGMSESTLSKYRIDHPSSIPFEKRGKFIWYRAGAVRKFIRGESGK